MLAKEKRKSVKFKGSESEPLTARCRTWFLGDWGSSPRLDRFELERCRFRVELDLAKSFESFASSKTSYREDIFRSITFPHKPKQYAREIHTAIPWLVR